MNDTPTPLCDALEDRLQHDSEASRDYELLCFSDLARDLERQLAEATAWRPIETAPKDGWYLILYGTGPARTVIGSWDDTANKWLTPLKFEWHPTHWQPLPNPPTV